MYFGDERHAIHSPRYRLLAPVDTVKTELRNRRNPITFAENLRPARSTLTSKRSRLGETICSTDLTFRGSKPDFPSGSITRTIATTAWRAEFTAKHYSGSAAPTRFAALLLCVRQLKLSRRRRHGDFRRASRATNTEIRR